MRWVLSVLLAANILYFLWEKYLDSPALEPVQAKQVFEPVLAENATVLLLGEAVSAERQGSVASPGEGKILLGGFVERERIEQLRQRLLSLGIDGATRQKQIPAELEYWVYLPPLSSRAATLRLLKELQARKLDGFLITQGELANGISLGIFPHENSAEAVQERLQQAGYQARIKQISRTQNAYWFEVLGAGERLLDEQNLQELLKDFPGMQYLQGG